MIPTQIPTVSRITRNLRAFHENSQFLRFARNLRAILRTPDILHRFTLVNLKTLQDYGRFTFDFHENLVKQR